MNEAVHHQLQAWDIPTGQKRHQRHSLEKEYKLVTRYCPLRAAIKPGEESFLNLLIWASQSLSNVGSEQVTLHISQMPRLFLMFEFFFFAGKGCGQHADFFLYLSIY